MWVRKYKDFLIKAWWFQKNFVPLPTRLDDSSFYPVRASVTAQPLARAFFMAKSQRA